MSASERDEPPRASSDPAVSGGRPPVTDSGPVRVPLVDPALATPDVRVILDAIAGPRGRLSKVFRALANSAEGAGRVASLGAYLRYEAATDDIIRESVVLAVARELDCTYEWEIHAAVLERMGRYDEVVEQLKRADRGELGTTQLDAIALARCVSRGEVAPESIVDRLQRELGASGYVDLVVTAAYYQFLARIIAELRVPRENAELGDDHTPRTDGTAG